MVEFRDVGHNNWIAEGHGLDEAELRDGLAAFMEPTLGADRARQYASVAVLAEAWYEDEHGFGHDCAQHLDVDKSLWSPGCTTFRPVTVHNGMTDPSRPIDRVA